MRHHNIHDHIGLALRRETATYLTVHGASAQLATVAAAINQLGDLIVTRQTPCPEPGASDCHWLEVVLSGDISITAFLIAYQAVLAANN